MSEKPQPSGPSEGFQAAVGAAVVLFVAVAIIGGLVRLFDGGDGQAVSLEETAAASSSDVAAPTRPPAGTRPLPNAPAQPSPSAPIPDARPIAETPVQLLDGVRDPQVVAAARDILEDLGYQIIAENRARRLYEKTTVLYLEGAEAEAAALQARDRRFTKRALTSELSDEALLHVVVGGDWPTQE